MLIIITKKNLKLVDYKKKQKIQEYINLLGFSFAFQIFSISDQDRMDEIQRQTAAATAATSNTNTQAMVTSSRRRRRRSRLTGGKPIETLKIELKLQEFKKILHQTCLLFFKPKGAKIIEEILLEALSLDHKLGKSKSKSKSTRKSKSKNSTTRKKPPSQ